MRKALSKWLRVDYGIGKTELDIGSRKIRIHDLRVADPKKPSLGPLLSVGQMDVNFSANPLGEGVAVRRVSLRKVRLNLSLVEGEEPDLSQILHEIKVDPTASQTPPAIHVEDSEVELRLTRDSKPILFHDLQLALRPVRDQPGQLQLRGTMISPLGVKVLIKGTGNSKTRGFRAVMESADVPVRAESAAMFSQAVASYLRQANISGTVRKASGWLEYRETDDNGAAPPSVWTGGASLTFDDFSATAPTFPYPIRAASGRVLANSNENGSLHFDLRKRGIDGDLDVTAKITHLFPDANGTFAPQFEIRTDAKGVLIGPKLKRAVANCRLPIAKRIAAAFKPSGGRASLSLHLHNDQPGGKTKATADVDLQGVAGSFAGFEPTTPGRRRIGFPMPIHNASGRVRIRPGFVSLEGLTAEVGDSGKLQLSGSVPFGDGNAYPDLKIEGQQVVLDASLRDALSGLMPDGATIYDDYRPAGLCNLSVRVRAHPDSLTWSVNLQPQGGSIRYHRFPFLVHDVRGRLRITEEGVDLDLTGKGGKRGRLRGKGRFLFETNNMVGKAVPDDVLEGLRSELWIHATDAELDQDMRAALGTLSAKAQTAWDFVSPTGTIDGEVVLFKEWTSDVFDYDIRMDLRNGRVQPSSLPMPVEQVAGKVFFHGKGLRGRCQISSLRGKVGNGKGHGNADLLVHGQVSTDGGKWNADVSSVLRGLRLSDELGKALDAAGLFDAETQALLAVSGYVDVIGRQTKKMTEATFVEDYRVRLREVRSKAPMLPDEAHSLSGEVHLRNGRATFHNIQGLLGATPFRCQTGSFYRDGPASRLNFTVSAENFQIDKRLAKLMDGPVRQAFLDWQPSGAAKVTELRLEFRFPDNSPTFSSSFGGQIEALNLSLGRNLPIRNVNGTLTIEEGRFDGSGGHLRGRIRNATASFQGHQLHSLATDFAISAKETILRNLSLRLHGGLVQSAGNKGEGLRYQHAGKRSLRAALRWQGVSLSQLLRAADLASNRLQGTLSGNLKIADLPNANLLDLVASGNVAVTNGSLGKVPLFAPLYSYLKPDKRPRFHAGSAEFSIRKQTCKLRKLKLESDLLRIEGSGTVGLDGYIDILLRIPELLGPAADILLVPIILDPVVSRLVKFQLYGYARDIRTNLILPLKGRKGRQPLTPLPPPPPGPDSGTWPWKNQQPSAKPHHQ